MRDRGPFVPRAAVVAALRRAAAGLAVSLLAVTIGGAQESGSGKADPYRIFAVLWRGETEVEDGFRAQLTQRGVPFELTVRSLDLDRGNAPPIIEEIREARPDLVYTWGTGTTTSIVGRLDEDDPDSFVRDIPGIFVLVAYPLEAGIIENFARPGRPVTGVSFLSPVDVQLSAIVAYHPFKTVAVIFDETAGNSRINVASLRETAPEFGLRLLEYPIPVGSDGRPDPEELPELVERAKRDGAELLYMGPDSFLARHGDVFTAEAIRNGLPTFAATQAPLLNSRAMFGLVTEYYTLGRLAALQAERILVDEVPPEDLPVGRLSRYKLWINRDVVQEIGLYPPLEMIAVADFRESARD